MDDQAVGYYSEFWDDCIAQSRIEIIDPALGGVGGQAHKQVRVHYPDFCEKDMSYEDFDKEWQPVYLKDNSDDGR